MTNLICDEEFELIKKITSPIREHTVSPWTLEIVIGDIVDGFYEKYIKYITPPAGGSVDPSFMWLLFKYSSSILVLNVYILFCSSQIFVCVNAIKFWGQMDLLGFGFF